MSRKTGPPSGMKWEKLNRNLPPLERLLRYPPGTKIKYYTYVGGWLVRMLRDWDEKSNFPVVQCGGMLMVVRNSGPDYPTMALVKVEEE